MGVSVARIGIDTVNGGVIIGPGAPNVTAEGLHPVSTVGDLVSPHAPFTGDHLTATVVQGSATVFANGKAVTHIGSLCSCGHVVESGAVTVYESP